MDANLKPWLVGDIGGTNARFALVQPQESGALLELAHYRTADFASLREALEHFLQHSGGVCPQRAALAVASAVTGDQVRITNNPWHFSVAGLGRELGLQLQVLNDFAAVSLALPQLQPADLLELGPATSAESRGRRQAYAVVGPGTGLGVSGLVVEDGRSTVIESEGGHLGFAPADAFEAEILRLLLQRLERVSVERLVSGMGLSNLYEAICRIEGLPAHTPTPEEISAEAAAQPGSVGDRVLDLMAALLGSFAGDIALAFGAWQGVYLHGGVAQKLLPWLQRGAFRRRFEAKGRHAAVMRAIPTRLILHPQAGLLGAVASLSGD
ncbi:MAG TPA: glucokinase [Solimonas sp.]|nr:glucokinase [Solimonas sp.]